MLVDIFTNLFCETQTFNVYCKKMLRMFQTPNSWRIFKTLFYEHGIVFYTNDDLHFIKIIEVASTPGVYFLFFVKRQPIFWGAFDVGN